MSGWNDTKPADVADLHVNGNGTGAFGTSELSATLPETANDKDETADGWVQRTAYDYSAYGKETDKDAGQTRVDWDGNAVVYTWDGEEGELGPEVPELELQLFGDQEKRDTLTGIDFSKISEIQLVQEGPVRVTPVRKFQDAGLHPAMLNNVKLAGYKVPTPIQSYCLPAIHEGHDVIGIAQTGSGKTAAYLIPVINKLMGKAKKLAGPRPKNPLAVDAGLEPGVKAEPLVVVVAPTRELAVQIFNEARKLCYRSMLRPSVVYGGGPYSEQLRQINKGCDILVATPGRLAHFLKNPNDLSLERLKYIIIDEADEMLTDDWADQLGLLLSGGSVVDNITYLLFSATFPKTLRDIAATHLKEAHVRFRVGRAGSTHGNIVQQIVETAPFNKKAALIDLIRSLPPQRTIVFVNSKAMADDLDDFLFNECKLPCTSMHADRTQREREDALRNFRAGTTPILVATGISARGIDVRNVAHVINYDMPSMDHGGIEEYTHRIGRTGRIGHKGLATSFLTERDEPICSVLTRTLLETAQDIPDFLTQYIPDDKENLKFEADSDWEDEADGGANGADGGDAGAWGIEEKKEESGGAWDSSNDANGAKDKTEEPAAGAWGGGGDGWN